VKAEPPKLFAVLIAMAAFLTYWPSLHFQFVYDDLGQIVSNERIRSWDSLPGYFTQHVWPHMPDIAPQFYRPLFLVWLRINYMLFDAQPAGWHVTSMLAHAAAAVLLYALVLKIGKDWPLAATVAIIFAVYPVHAETVAWVSGSADVLLAIATFVCLLSFVRQARSNAFIGTAAFAVALLLKETAVVLLPLIFLQLYLDEESSHPIRKAARRTVPLLAVLIFYFGLRYAALGGLGATTANLPFRVTIADLPRLLWWYLANLFWPANLSAFHDFEIAPTASGIAVSLTGILVVALLFWAITRYVARSKAERTIAILAVALIILPILPVLKISSLDPTNLVHERYLYLPSTGLCMLLALCFNRIFEAMLPAREAGLLITGIVAALLAMVTIKESSFWKDEITLYTRGLQTAPHSVAVKNNLGVALIEQGNCAAAMPLLQQATELDPRDWLAFANMGECATEAQDWIIAEKYYNRAVELNPMPVLVQQLQAVRRKLQP
jgi:tetratricopeptide (TPR) repeat protein